MIDKTVATPQHTPITSELRVRYLAALIDCDRVAVSRTVDQGLASGLDVPTLLLDVVAPAQWEIGELWHRRRVTIAQEHWATEATRQEIERILFVKPPTTRLGRSVLVAAAPEEIHALPARIVAGLFHCRGWEVDFLGQSPPIDDFVDYVAKREPDLLALSLTLAQNQTHVRELGQKLGELETTPPILIGGAGSQGMTPAELGVDAIATDAIVGLETANQLIGLGSDRDPKAYLDVVGRRIQRLRTGLGISQAVLAERSGLTRPYLSAVERGKQNITLEASLRIAAALEIGMTDLLDEAT